jgi:hypothetical protein
MNYPYIKITITEHNAPKEGERYGESHEIAIQIINREWFMEYEMLKRIMAVIYDLEPRHNDFHAIREALKKGEA